MKNLGMPASFLPTGHNLHIGRRNPLGKFMRGSETYDHMAVSFGWSAVDDVDQTVLQTTGPQ